MKFKLYQTLILGIIYCMHINGQSGIMTYNLRYNNPEDKENWWEYRKNDVVKLIRYYKPDILGIQEGLHAQVNYLDSMLPGYKYTGVGRDDGKQKGEYAAVFYNILKFELLDTETYWLSENPDTVSVGWDASMERIVTFGIFKDIGTKDTLFVFNAHFDHIGEIARKRSAELIISLIDKKQLQEKQVIIMGDLNSEPVDKPVRILANKFDDSFEVSNTPPYGPVGTFNYFDIGRKLDQRLDYILVKNLEVQSYRAIDDRRANNLYPSDHLPVYIVLSM